MRTRWYLSPFGHLLHDPNLWGIRRRSVVPAFALGIFVAFLPTPGHMVIAALLAIAFRVNLPVAVLATWVINPLIMYPVYSVTYEFGRYLLNMEPHAFDFELSFAWLADGFGYVWAPLILGCVVLGALASLTSYIALDMLWRASISDYLKKRRARKAAQQMNED
jgi:uncharacterized protein (DUF2062 family)